jgi:quinol monooxygenase YgiN
MKNSMKSLLLILSALVLIQFSGCSQGVVKDGVVTKLNDGQITLAVIIEAKEGKEAELKKALLAIVEPTRAEKGCLHYVLHTDPKDDGRFMFYENWENVELWNDHLNSPHIKAFGEKAGELVANQLDVTNWVIYE